jgi:hypothetical protein
MRCRLLGSNLAKLPRTPFRTNLSIGVYNRLMFLSELIDLRTRESPTEAPHFSFRLESPYSEPLLNPI